VTTLLFYENPVALNKQRHKALRLKNRGEDYGFAANTNSVILAGVEFSEAAREYPIVFANAGGHIVPVALLGLKSAQNLFVKEDARWDARYIPAFVRRYPFVLAETESGRDRMVCIDEGFSGFDEENGEPLFENDEPTPLLKQAMDFLEEYQKQYARTEIFVKKLVELELLKSLNAKVELANEAPFGLTGLMVVDEQKLLRLPDDQALTFFKSGELAWVYCHLMSLGCLSLLLERVNKGES